MGANDPLGTALQSESLTRLVAEIRALTRAEVATALEPLVIELRAWRAGVDQELDGVYERGQQALEARAANLERDGQLQQRALEARLRGELDALHAAQAEAKNVLSTLDKTLATFGETLRTFEARLGAMVPTIVVQPSKTEVLQTINVQPAELKVMPAAPSDATITLRRTPDGKLVGKLEND